MGLTSGIAVINNAYATASVKGTQQEIGGLVGYVGLDVGGTVTTTISNVYATGAVSGGTFHLGGLLGGVFGTTTITNAYATGAVTAAGKYAGGLVGYTSGATTIKKPNHMRPARYRPLPTPADLWGTPSRP